MQGRGALSGVFFIQPGKVRSSSPGMESDHNVNDERSHDGVAPRLALEHEVDANNYADAGHATESCTRGADCGRQHECTSYIKTLQEVCSRFENDNEMLRRKAVDLELVKKRHRLQVLQLQLKMKEMETELNQLRVEGAATGRPPSAASLNSPPELAAFNSNASFTPSSPSSSDSHFNIRSGSQGFTAREWSSSAQHGTGAPCTPESLAWHVREKVKPFSYLPRRKNASASDASKGEMESSVANSPDRHGRASSTVARPVRLGQPEDTSNELCKTGEESFVLHPASRCELDTSSSFDLDVWPVTARKHATIHTMHEQQVQEKHRSSAVAAVVEPLPPGLDRNGCVEADSRKNVTTPELHSTDGSVSTTTQSVSFPTSERPADAATSCALSHSLSDFWTGDSSQEAISMTQDTTDCAEDAAMPVVDDPDGQGDVSENSRREGVGQWNASLATGVKRFENPSEAVSSTRPGNIWPPPLEVRGETLPGEDGQNALQPTKASSVDSDVAPALSKPRPSDDVTKPPQGASPSSSRTEVEVISNGQAFAHEASTARKEVGENPFITSNRQHPILAVQPARSEAFNATGGRIDDVDVRPKVSRKDGTIQAFHKPQVQGKQRRFVGAAMVEPRQLESDQEGCEEVEHGKGFMMSELHAAGDNIAATTRTIPPCITKSTASSERSKDASSAPNHSLNDFWTGDTSGVLISVSPDTTNCAEDAGLPAVDDYHRQNDVSEEKRGQRDASRVTSVKHLGDSEISADHDTRPRSVLSPQCEVRDEKRPVNDGQDILPPDISSLDSDAAPTVSSPQEGALPSSSYPAAISGGQASARDASLAPKEAGEKITFTQTRQQPTCFLAVRPAAAEVSNTMGVSTHVMICSYCNAPPPRDGLVAMCEGCPRRLCVDCLRNDIQGATDGCGGLDHRTRALLEGRSGDIFIEECPWCKRKSDFEFAPASEGTPPMKHLLQELLRHDLSYCFREPVNVEIHPDYLETIGRGSMMDLGTMMIKLRSQKYPRRRGPGQFVEDLCKIWRNCRKFAGCNELGQSLHGTSVPGIVRCALILEAMSTKYVHSYISPHCDNAWPESAWDYYRQRRQREEEEARLRRVELRDHGAGRGPTECRLVEESNSFGPETYSSNNVREAKTSDQQEAPASASSNKKPRLEKVNSSTKGQDFGQVLDVSNVPPLSKGCGSMTKPKAGGSNAQRYGNWKPLEELCDVATSFTR